MAKTDIKKLSLAESEGRGGSLVIDGAKFAIGLVWLHDDNASESASATRAKKAARSYRDADLYTFIDGESAQYALASSKAGHTKGSHSLAATLANTLQGSILGAFEVEGGIYLIAIQPDGILSTSDVLIVNSEQAQQEFHTALHAGVWDQKFCPAAWEIQGTSAKRLEEVILDAPKSGKLRPVSNLKLVIKGLALVVFLATSYAAYDYYTAWQQEQLEIAETDRKAKEAADERAARLAAAKALPPYIWNGKVVGPYSLALCVEGILSAPIAVPGWRVTSLTCGGQGNMTMLVTREAGATINWIGAFLNQENFRPSVRQINNTSAEISWAIPLGDLPKYPNTAGTGNSEQALRYLVTNFEEIYVPITAKIVDAAPVQVPDIRNPNKTQQVVLSRAISFEYSTQMDPRDFLELLAPLPVITIDKITLSVRDWSWKVEGQIHEKLYDPTQPPSPGNSGGRPSG